MKTKLLLLVCAALVTFSSAFAQTHVRGQLKVGAAKIDVTPGPDQLGRNSYGVLDHTHFRVILFTNGTKIAGLANVDGNANQRCVDAVNERIEKEFGIPQGNIIYNGTYCHLLEEYESLNEQMRSVLLKQFEDCRTVFDVVRKLEGW